eukprot:m.335696 g.335696  ORF g.335696 m.335696 type:complete len:167 (-) comp16077_c1_seq2:3927-4427(-)
MNFFAIGNMFCRSAAYVLFMRRCRHTHQDTQGERRTRIRWTTAQANRQGFFCWSVTSLCVSCLAGIVGSGLQHLDLSNNAIGSGDAHWVPALTQALNAQNSHLTSLNLYKTQIDDEAACVIAQAIGASRLSELNIGYNRFGQSGLEAICTSCATLPTLRKLHARTL